VISRREIERRISLITEEMRKRNLDALYLASASNIAYNQKPRLSELGLIEIFICFYILIFLERLFGDR
jgi:hypothetical protein